MRGSWQWQWMVGALLIGIGAALAGCADPAASESAGTIRNEMARLAEEARANDPLAMRNDRPDPCAGVSDAEVQRVEAQMGQLDRELVVLGADEMRALECSRSRR